MKLYQVVMKDVQRRRKRVLYAALGVVIGIATFVGILTVALGAQEKIYRQLDKYGANLTVTPAISSLDMKLGDLNVGTLTVGENYIEEEKVGKIREIANSEISMALGLNPVDNPNPATVAPKLFVGYRLNETGVIVVGVDPGEERRLKVWWKMGQGEYLAQPNDVLVGSQAAEQLKLSPGEAVTLNGASLRVVGVLEETGSPDDFQLFMALATVQQVFGKPGVVSSIDIRAQCNACPVETIATAVNTTIPGVRAVAVQQIAANEMGLVERVSNFLLVLAAITLAVGAFGVVNTMMTSVHERVKDIGIMRSVGASGGQIIKVFMYEAVIIGLIGGIAGYLLGSALAYVTGPLVFEGATVSLVPQYIPLSAGLAVIIAVASSVYPAFRASKIKVAASFRSL